MSMIFNNMVETHHKLFVMDYKDRLKGRSFALDGKEIT